MRASLRTRIFAACFGIGAGMGVFFGALSLGLLEMMEFEQVDLILRDELRSFIHAHQRDPDIAPPRTSFIDAWAVPRSAADRLPADLRQLGPGVHEIDAGASERRVAIADRGEFRYAVSMDLTLMEQWEDRVTGAVVVLVALCTLLAALLGRWLADRAVTPLVGLARRVAQAPPEAPGATAGGFAAGLGDDEVGRLARALDAYSGLLMAHARRERDFSSQAGHELRTPVAITATSVELVLADPTLSPRSRAQLERASRALQWMNETLEALMAMARGQADTGRTEVADISRIVRELVPVAGALLEGKPVRLQCEIADGVSLAALTGAARSVVRNLLVNACANTAAGWIRVTLDPQELCIRDTGSGIRPGEESMLFEPFRRGAQSSHQGEGLGLAIVRRVCEHYGWQVSLARNAEGGTEARVRFRPAAAGR